MAAQPALKRQRTEVQSTESFSSNNVFSSIPAEIPADDEEQDRRLRKPRYDPSLPETSYYNTNFGLVCAHVRQAHSHVLKDDESALLERFETLSPGHRLLLLRLFCRQGSHPYMGGRPAGHVLCTGGWFVFETDVSTRYHASAEDVQNLVACELLERVKVDSSHVESYSDILSDPDAFGALLHMATVAQLSTARRKCGISAKLQTSKEEMVQALVRVRQQRDLFGRPTVLTNFLLSWNSHGTEANSSQSPSSLTLLRLAPALRVTLTLVDDLFFLLARPTVLDSSMEQAENTMGRQKSSAGGMAIKSMILQDIGRTKLPHYRMSKDVFPDLEPLFPSRTTFDAYRAAVALERDLALVTSLLPAARSTSDKESNISEQTRVAAAAALVVICDAIAMLLTSCASSELDCWQNCRGLRGDSHGVTTLSRIIEAAATDGSQPGVSDVISCRASSVIDLDAAAEIRACTMIFDDKECDRRTSDLLAVTGASLSGSWNDHLKLLTTPNLVRRFDELNQSLEERPTAAQFSVEHILARTLYHACGDLCERQMYHKRAIAFSRLLLACPMLAPVRRGKLFSRCATNLDVHSKRPSEALALCEHGLKVCGCSNPSNHLDIRGGARVELKRRAVRLAKPPRRWRELQIPADEFELLEENPPTRFVTSAHQLSSGANDRWGKSTFASPIDGRQLDVEGLTTEHYLKTALLGYEARHCEGGWLRMLCILMTWNCVFDDVVRDAWQSPWQSSPLDFGSVHFWNARKHQLEARLLEIEAASLSDSSKLIDLLQEASSQVGTTAIGCNWNTYSWDDMMCILQCLHRGKVKIASLFRLLLEDWGVWSSGLPDLVFWSPEGNSIKVVEVKGPRDILSGKQRSWIAHMIHCGLDTEVCRVTEIGNSPKAKVPRTISIEKVGKIAARRDEATMASTQTISLLSSDEE